MLLMFAIIAGLIMSPPTHQDGFLVTEVAAVTRPVISNPYADVDWNTWGQYKAALHSHTRSSDGASRVATTLETMYGLGFHIAAITDHNVNISTPDRALTGLATNSVNAGQNREPLITPNRLEQMANGVGRTDGRGMLAVPHTNERSSLIFNELTQQVTPLRGHHINTFWTQIGNQSREPIPSLLTRMQIEGGGGLAFLNHIGRNTGAEIGLTGTSQNAWNRARDISNDPRNYMPYADLFINHQNLIGMEINTKFDAETQADRVIWDNILGQTMPAGRPVWGYATDDSHFCRSIGFAYNLMLMPDLSIENFRTSMETGAFFAFSRVDRQYRVFPGRIEPHHWYGRRLSEADGNAVLEMSVPEITSVDVNQTAGTISLSTSRVDRVRWYGSNGFIAETTSSPHVLNINTVGDTSFVRAAGINASRGVIYTQPFGINIPGTIPVLAEIIEPQAIEAPLGAPATVIGLGLPAGIQVRTESGQILPATVVWNLNGINYNPDSPLAQNFEVTGTVRLNPHKISNPNSIPLTVTIMVSTAAYICRTCVTNVFTLDYSRLSPWGAESGADGRALGSITPRYRPGIRRQTGADNNLTLVGYPNTTAFRWSADAGRDLNIDVGFGGGTHAATRDVADGFAPQVGQMYEIRFAVSGNGSLGLRGNNHDTSPPERHRVRLTPVSQNVTHTWTQTQAGGGFAFNFGSPGNYADISNLRIYRINICGGTCDYDPPCCPDYPMCDCGDVNVCFACDQDPCVCPPPCTGDPATCQVPNCPDCGTLCSDCGQPFDDCTCTPTCTGNRDTCPIPNCTTCPPLPPVLISTLITAKVSPCVDCGVDKIWRVVQGTFLDNGATRVYEIMVAKRSITGELVRLPCREMSSGWAASSTTFTAD